ncbi:RSP_7527 family protein [Marinobacter halodurans]|uniref:RSP_7527 family protein n=1 Tax=Marinobacter halodurans TaxID=2528979 RepID=UPI0013F1732E|nr:hypothetical protein [Marinobacter halodurans]
MAKQTLKTDTLGNIDIDYYIQIAHQQRSEYVAELGSALKARIKGFFRAQPAKLSTSH